MRAPTSCSHPATLSFPQVFQVVFDVIGDGWSWSPRTPESGPWDGRELVLAGRVLEVNGAGSWCCWELVPAELQTRTPRSRSLGWVRVRCYGGVGSCRNWCWRGVCRSVSAVVMVGRWRVCGEMRESLAEEHVVDGVVSLCHCAVLLYPPLQLVRCWVCRWWCWWCFTSC